MAFHPYLFFGGNCRQAFTRYQEIFGGELVLLTAADMPAEERPSAADDLIMHAALAIGDQLLMGSDDPTADSFGPVQGMMVNYSTDDVADRRAGVCRAVRGGRGEPADRPDVVVGELRHVRRPVRDPLDDQRRSRRFLTAWLTSCPAAPGRRRAHAERLRAGAPSRRGTSDTRPLASPRRSPDRRRPRPRPCGRARLARAIRP